MNKATILNLYLDKSTLSNNLTITKKLSGDGRLILKCQQASLPNSISNI